MYNEHPEYVLWLLTHMKNEAGQRLSPFLDYCEKRILHEEQCKAAKERDRLSPSLSLYIYRERQGDGERDRERDRQTEKL